MKPEIRKLLQESDKVIRDIDMVTTLAERVERVLSSACRDYSDFPTDSTHHCNPGCLDTHIRDDLDDVFQCYGGFARPEPFGPVGGWGVKAASEWNYEVMELHDKLGIPHPWNKDHLQEELDRNNTEIAQLMERIDADEDMRNLR